MRSAGPLRAIILSISYAASVTSIAAAQTYGEIALHDFATPPMGANPVASLVLDAEGNLYGTTADGGELGDGVVFKVDPAGHQTILHTFAGGDDGHRPFAGLIRDTAGNLYGTTVEGGKSDMGVVYKLDPSGKETILHAFAGEADGATPYATLVRDPQGNLYGVAQNGGSKQCGVIFKVDSGGRETTLYDFTCETDGAFPYGGLARDASGNLYGTASQGGGEFGESSGTVFKLSPTGRLTVLYTFTGRGDGGYPQGGVILDSAGNIYGTTPGTVYKVTPSGKETVLHGFGSAFDGGDVESTLIRDAQGNLYGTTLEGGPNGVGIVFKISPSGEETVLHSFISGHSGDSPVGGLVRDAVGNLYGTTAGGGPGNVGVVFKLTSAGEVTRLYGFPGPIDGYSPDSPLVRDGAGNLYGVTMSGGTGGYGVLFKMPVSGHESVMHAFLNGADCAYPAGKLAIDSSGTIYGSTEAGGSGWGCVYKVGDAGKETILYRFKGGRDGSMPVGGIFRGRAGNIYGTTEDGGGGEPGYGTVFEIDPAGHESILHYFGPYTDGSSPSASVVRDAAGNLYGSASAGGTFEGGLVYKLDSSGNEMMLYSFSEREGAVYPSDLTLGSAGNVYGTTEFGGTDSAGVVFEVDPSGLETNLYNFTGKTDGGNPEAGLAVDSAGNLYGTTTFGGAHGLGVVFKISPQGEETVLHSFAGGADGSYPEQGVTLDPTGNIYGVTSSGGMYQGGIVFELKRYPAVSGHETNGSDASLFEASVNF